MSDFQRLLSRERDLAKQRGDADGDLLSYAAEAAATRPLGSGSVPAPANVTAWREYSDALADLDTPLIDPEAYADSLSGPRPAKSSSSNRKRNELLAARRLHKSYRKGRVEVPVLRGVDLHVSEGEFVAIVGQSGCGKTTLLHLLGALDAPDGGEIYFDGRRVDQLASRGRDELRNRAFGMIFQFYHLLPELTMLENVLAPLMIAQSVWQYRWQKRQHIAAATELLGRVGLGHRIHHKPRELSGGEMQRAAIARALIAQPRVLFADEPTGNLDAGTGQEILRILRTLNRDQNLTIVMVTHDAAIAATADRTIRLAEGKAVQE